MPNSSILAPFDPQFIVVDLFCGFGGTTTGYATATVNGQPAALVAACVNHDWKAIQSHWMNNPDVEHFNEDITKLYGHIVYGLLFRSPEFLRLKRLVDLYRAFYPGAKVVLWASLECTNFSKAKGGMARDADSRTLANHLDRYIRTLDPDYVKIENVVEFMSWGPLISKVVKDSEGHQSCPVKFVANASGKLKAVWQGIPESTKNGQEWMRWCKDICSLGYRDDWKELNSANFGAYTSRNRLFGIFAKPGMPIVWPEPTHAKNPDGKAASKTQGLPGLFAEYNGAGGLKEWKAVKEVLDFSDEGESIFNRKKPLADNTLERVYAGLVKFVAQGDTAFLSKYFSGTHKDKNISVHAPAGSITTVDHHSIVQTAFLSKYYSGEPASKNTSVNNPAGTLRTKDGQALIQPQFLAHYYSGGGQTSSIDDPCPTVTAMDGKALIQPEFLTIYNSKSKVRSVEDPAPTIATNDRFGLVQPEPFLMPTNYANGPRSVEEPSPTITASRRYHYLINPSWGGNPGSVDSPCCVIVARQDKAPLYFVQVEQGPVSVAVYDNDSPIAIKIKQFMAAYGLVDIKMRMLRVPELLRIQGFPDTYKMVGNQGDQKKFIGNSVVPHVVKAWAEALLQKPSPERQLAA